MTPSWKKNSAILLAAGLLIALPFLLRRETGQTNWREGDPVLVIVSPHNEAIRREFGEAFSRWHEARYGAPVKVDWRAVGGATEIMRFLRGQFLAAFRGWRRREHLAWSAEAGEAIFDRAVRKTPATAPGGSAGGENALRRELWESFRAWDDAERFSSGIDLLFGGGVYDHQRASEAGLCVAPWTEEEEFPPPLRPDAQGRTLIPESAGGETWRSETFFGTALSTFGICYNPDRLRDLGIEHPPQRWADLTDPRYAGHIGVADPSKSGSIAKAFEMIVQGACHAAVRRAGFDEARIRTLERRLSGPEADGTGEEPEAYRRAIAAGWRDGLALIQQIGANARYFTDAAGKVPLDVGSGAAAAGIAIDFYGRFQAEYSGTSPDGTPRLVYRTPKSGSSVSADPIALLRGAPHREIARRFIRFTLSEAGQRLWNYRPGTPGGPQRFALRRLPIRRDFYPAPDDPELQAAFLRHAAYTSDPLGDPDINPYAIVEGFTYHPRWTARHFSVQRDLIRAMCIDAGQELRAAWAAIGAAGGPEANPEAMRRLRRLPDRPEPLRWSHAPEIIRRYERVDYLREWTLFFRRSYAEARDAARAADRPAEKAEGTGR